MVHHVQNQDPELRFEMMIDATFTMPDDFSNPAKHGMQNPYK